MTQRQNEVAKSHAHSLEQNKLEWGMHLLSRVYLHLHEMGDIHTIYEIQGILNVEMDECFTRRMKGGR